MYIGDIIQQYMTDNRLSLRAFADRCEGISFGYIHTLVKGKNPNTKKPSRPSDEKIEAIARGMGISFDQLKDMMKDRPVTISHSDGIQQSFSQKFDNLIEDEINSRVNERIKNLQDPDDPEKWIPLAPGFYDMPVTMQKEFKAAVSSIWRAYHTLSTQQRKDEDE